MDRLAEYLDYHGQSSAAGDIDPANDCLRYLCERFELNIEQRFWLAFLYATCYSATTTFFLYNEFPDYETVDLDRLARWWETNRPRVIFQTDRRWCRSRNQFVDCVKSYRELVGKLQQPFWSARVDDYASCYELASRIHTFGRFTLFIYLEMLHTIAGLQALEPDTIDWRNAESSRNGLCFALGRDDLMNHHTKQRLTSAELADLDVGFQRVSSLVRERGSAHTNLWNIETTLCAYKKHKLGKRWVGYYIERMRREMVQMEAAVPEGVCWDVLWDFRKETYDRKWLRELS